MTYDGWLRFGGVEIANSPRAFGYARTAGCAGWLTYAGCGTLEDALGDAAYVYSNITSAPWYDSANPDVSSRFYGVYISDLSGIEDSTRQVQTVESAGPGGQVGHTRRGMKRAKVRAVLLARGDDAMEYGRAWLDRVLSETACGVHGARCGTTDLEFLAACPPERDCHPGYSPWEEEKRNTVPNPSMERVVPGGGVWRRNLLTNGGFRAGVGGWSRRGSATSAEPVWEGAEEALSVTVTAGGGGVYTDLSTVKDEAISARVDVRPPEGHRVRLYFYNVTTATWSAFAESGVGTADGDWETLRLENVASIPGNAYRLYARADSVTSVPATFSIRRAIVEEGPGANLFFDGATTDDSGATYQWEGAANASASRALAGTFALRANLFPNPAAVSTSGFSSSAGQFDVTHTGSAVRFTALASVASAAALSGYYPPEGVSHRVLVRARASRAIQARLRVRITLGPYITIGTNWAWYELTAIAGNGSTQQTGFLVDAGAASVGDWIEIDRALVAVAPDAGPWFSGNVSTDPDYVAGWNGAENDSSSTQKAALVSDASTGSPTAIVYSQRWAEEGRGSARVVPRTATVDTMLSMGGDVGALRLGLTPGKTYTVSATIRLAAPQTGNLDTRARRMEAFTKVGSAAYVTTSSATAPNQAGVTDLSLTLVVPEGATEAFVRLYNGASIGNGDVWWDSFSVVEGDSVAYFDGDSIADDPDREQYRWLGVPNASISVFEVREDVCTPFTDEEYEEIQVAPLRRRMHDVAAIEGPFRVNVAESDGIVMHEVEWGFVSERPYVFGNTRRLELPSFASTVVDDLATNLVRYPSADLTTGTPTLATNLSTNPSLESDTATWSAAAATIAGTAPGAMLVGARSTDKAASGTYSYRARLFGNSTEIASSQARIHAQHDVALTGVVAGDRISAHIWGAVAISAGGAVSSVQRLRGIVEFRTASAQVSTVELGDIDPADYAAGADLSLAGIVVPATATVARIAIVADVTWRASATAANNSDIRVYADKATVSKP